MPRHVPLTGAGRRSRAATALLVPLQVAFPPREANTWGQAAPGTGFLSLARHLIILQEDLELFFHLLPGQGQILLVERGAFWLLGHLLI